MVYPNVPVMNSNLTPENRAVLLKQILAAKASRVWIALDRCTLFEDRREAMARLNENLRFFEQAGLEVGVWFQAYGFGDPAPCETGWTLIRSYQGVERQGADCFCPEDPAFCAAYLRWVEDIAAQKPRLMMLDDDLCLSVRPGIGCFCAHHQKLLGFTDLTGLFEGEANEKRRRFLQVMGETHRSFCRKVRAAVDKIDPTVRVGLCAGYTSWDLEGTDPPELARILAGKTEPFFRLTAAPYWAAPKKQRFPGQRLSAIIENARNQAVWCKEIEIFAEADSYPRPCYNTPAMLVENFDIAMQASGIPSLKYLFDYHSSAEYETQYWRIHTRNLPFYEKTAEAFAGATPCGVRVFRPAHRLAEETLPIPFAGEKAVMRRYFSGAAAMLAAHAIPVCYEGAAECAVVFGEDARWLEGASRVVLDLPAALLLQKNGADVGLKEVYEAPTPQFEFFGREKVLIQGDPRGKGLSLEEGAEVLSRFDNGEVASYCYGKYLVLNFDGIDETSTYGSCYARGRQLQEFFGFPYPAILGYSELYAICAQKEGGHTVLFQNHSMDPVFDFEILLPKRCKAFKLYGAEGVAEGNKLRILSELAPQGSILLEIQYENEE